MAIKRFSGIGAWVRWAVSEKKIVYLIVFALAAAGIAGLKYMNKDEFPTFQIKEGLVAGIYPGATAAEVEQQLARPLEETLFSYREVNRAVTKSVSKDGICYIYVGLNCKQSKKDDVLCERNSDVEVRNQETDTSCRGSCSCRHGRFQFSQFAAHSA